MALGRPKCWSTQLATNAKSSALEFEMATEMLKRYKSPGNDRIPA